VVDRVVTTAVVAAPVLVGVALASVVVMTLYKGLPALSHLNFFTEDMSGVRADDPFTKGGILHALVGTIIEVAIAVAISMPLGVATAVFMSEVGGRGARLVRTDVEAMTALPSIVAGLFVCTADERTVADQVSQCRSDGRVRRTDPAAGSGCDCGTERNEPRTRRGARARPGRRLALLAASPDGAGKLAPLARSPGSWWTHAERAKEPDRVTFTASEDADHVRLVVTGDGAGADESMREPIFEPGCSSRHERPPHRCGGRSTWQSLVIPRLPPSPKSQVPYRYRVVRAQVSTRRGGVMAAARPWSTK
jgi:hypothetical protein